MADRYITVAIHTYEKAVALRALLESEGISVEFRNVNIEQPVVASGIRVRIKESDLPLALRVIENKEIFTVQPQPMGGAYPVKPVVVPIDFTDKSMVSIIAAFRIANRLNTPVTLLHSYIDPYLTESLQLTDSMTYEIADMEGREQIKNTALTQMRHISSKIKEMIKTGELPAVKFKTEVVEGVPEDAITEYVRDQNPTLIVMATRCSEKKEVDLIGSVTAEVLDKCRFSVLALHECTRPSQFKNILFLCSVDQQDILAIDTLYRLFTGKDTKVTIAALPTKRTPFSSVRSPKAIGALLDYCKDNFKDYNFSSVVLGDTDPVADLHDMQRKEPFDLIVTPNKKKKIFARLFSPSLAHKVLQSASIPLLVIPV